MSQKPAARPDVNVVIDGRKIAVPEGMLVVEAAKAAGTTVPVYCYHPKLDPAGLCRICLVEIEKMPKLQIACATRVTEGMVVHTASAKVAEARRGVLEFLLLNHPLDCPICDKGGECDLQDFSMSYGAGISRLTEPKLHKPKAVDLGPTIVLDEERCILCRRCTRFDDEIAQERTLIVNERGHDCLISTRDGKPYASYFSGNTTEICPVGALTSKAYRFRSRPWDLTHTDSICTQCSVGCNFRIDSRFGRIMRTFTRENPAVDDGWICDRGRYTFNHLYAPARLRHALVRTDDRQVPASFDEAIARVAERLGRAAKTGRVGVIGGGRLSDEEAFALQKFAREALGTQNIDYRAHIQRYASPASFEARLTDLDDADLILMFGAYTPEQAPVLDLRLRKAVARRHARLMHIGPYRPDYPVEVQHVGYPPGALADLMEQLADAVHHGKEETGEGFVADIAGQLVGAEKVVAIHNGRNVAAAAALERLMETLHRFDHQVGILVVGAQGNARGAEAAGCVPNLGPGYAPTGRPDGMTTEEMLAAAAAGELDALFVVGANPALTTGDGTLARAALARVPFLAVVDLVRTETASHADVVLPAAGFAEKRGHVTNLEGRRQAFGKAVEPPVDVATDAEILSALSRELGHAALISADPDALFVQLLEAEAAVTRPRGAALPRPKVVEPETSPADQVDATHRRFTVVPYPQLYAGGGAAAHDPGLAPMRPQPFAIFNPADAARLGAAPGDRVALAGAGGTIEVDVRVGEQAPVGVVCVSADMPEAPENLLLDASGFGCATAVKVVAASEVPA